jgi:RNA polymerase sigma factor (sigma-70 family)
MTESATERELLVGLRRQAMATTMRAGVGDEALCDEVAQEVMVRAWRCGVLSMSPRVRGAWVRTTARRCAIDMVRAARREVLDESAIDGTGSVGAHAMTEERVDARRRVATVAARAGAMPPSLRAVFDAVVCEGRAIEDVARSLGVTRAVVDTRLRRMRVRLAG